MTPMTSVPLALLQALLSCFACSFLYILLPLAGGWRGLRHMIWPERLSLALLLGISLQALLGTLLSLLGLKALWFNLVLYVGLCAGLRVFIRPVELSPQESGPRYEALWLSLLIAIGLLSRWLHPLSTPALGQSDAYSHLMMLRLLLEEGLSVGGYPPGFARLMALPCLLFRMDPYWLARFGGAFWAGGLLLGSWWMARRALGQPLAALVSVALLAGFPALNLLQKTGVGLFPNQAGLMLLPYCFGALLLCVSEEKALRHLGWQLGALSLLSLILLVPMMSLHVLLIALLFGFWQLLRKVKLSRRHWLLGSAVVLLLLGLGYGLSGLLPSPLLSTQIEVFVSGDEASAAAEGLRDLSLQEALRILLLDFFTLKRSGLGQGLFNVAAILLMLMFLCGLLAGFRLRDPGWVLLGLWGGITLLQTSTGLAQFTAYQREGWSLMLALALFAGRLAMEILRCLPMLKPLCLPASVLVAAMGLLLPPSHVLSNSTAEAELLRLARALQRGEEVLPGVDPEEELLLLTRPLLQESMFPAVAGRSERLRYSDRFIWRSYAEEIAAVPQTLILLDPHPDPVAGEATAFSTVSPEAAARFQEQQQRSYDFNRNLERYARDLAGQGYRVMEGELEGGLRYYLLRKQPGNE